MLRFSGSDLLYLFRAVVKLWKSSDSIAEMWAPLWLEVSSLSLTHTHRHVCVSSCIEKWIKGQGGGKCPQCNAKTKRTDIRVIFAKSIRVLDTTERDRAIQVCFTNTHMNAHTHTHTHMHTHTNAPTHTY